MLVKHVYKLSNICIRKATNFSADYKIKYVHTTLISHQNKYSLCYRRDYIYVKLQVNIHIHEGMLVLIMFLHVHNHRHICLLLFSSRAQ
jgi:hypothetical protein